MASKKFDKEVLKDLVHEDYDPEEFKIQQNELVDNTRWELVYELVFTELSTNKSYTTTYSLGATECQESRPFEYDPKEIECDEVYPREVTVVRWERC